jgi:hypothetical protein
MVTIGIPTYNRAEFLRGALGYALNQTYRNLEIFVSDNASTDNTAEVVASYPDPRIRYQRNATNLGAARNFQLLAEMAKGEFFLWLQDDDLIRANLIERAVLGFQMFPSAVAYTPYTLISSSNEIVYEPGVFGPPVPVNWASGDLVEFPGSAVAVFSMFTHFISPPTAVYRTPNVLPHLHRLSDPANFLRGDRTLSSAAVRTGTVVVDPYIGGLYHLHDDQAWRQDVLGNGRWREKIAYACKTLDEVARSPGPDCMAAFQALLPEYSNAQLAALFAAAVDMPVDVPLCRQAHDAIRAELVQRGAPPANGKLSRPAYKLLKAVTPPIIVRAVKAVGKCLW